MIYNNALLLFVTCWFNVIMLVGTNWFIVMLLSLTCLINERCLCFPCGVYAVFSNSVTCLCHAFGNLNNYV